VNDEPNAPFLKYGVNSRSHTYYKSLGNSVRITRFPICTAFEERCTNESSLEAGAIDESNGSATNSDQPTQAGRRYRDDLVTIRMARIRPPLLDLRVSRDPAAIRAIAADIASGQLLQLPDVRRLDDGSYRVVFGYTRVLASQELGRDKLDAKLIVCPGDNDEIMVGLTENLSRTDLTDTELARAFAMLKAQGKTGKEIAPLFRTNQSKVSRLGKVLQNPLLGPAALDGQISWDEAAEMRRVPHAALPELLERVIRRRADGKPVQIRAELRSWVAARCEGDDHPALLDRLRRLHREFVALARTMEGTNVDATVVTELHLLAGVVSGAATRHRPADPP